MSQLARGEMRAAAAFSFFSYGACRFRQLFSFDAMICAMPPPPFHFAAAARAIFHVEAPCCDACYAAAAWPRFLTLHIAGVARM